jgi:hypothetical protein
MKEALTRQNLKKRWELMCKEWVAKASPLPKILLRSAILPVSFDMVGLEVPFRA